MHVAATWLLSFLQELDLARLLWSRRRTWGRVSRKRKIFVRQACSELSPPDISRMMRVLKEGRVERSLSFQAKREVLHQMAPQYRQASASQKRTLLESFITTTGYVRKYARWLLNHAEEVKQMDGHSHLSRYGPEVQHALFLVWNAANRICAKRLIPFLPTLIDALERHEHLQITEEGRKQLLSMSAATADRRLVSRLKLGRRSISTTRAGTLRQQRIPIRTLQ